MTTYFDPDGQIKFVISLRAERPIEGCELAPHPFLYIKGGAMDNPTRAKMMDANPHQFLFKWKRGPRRAMCENQTCSRREIFEPAYWSRIGVDGPPLQCVVCEKLGVPKHESTFCSKSCFKLSWKEHSHTRHTASQISAIKRRQKAITDEDGLIILGAEDEYIISSNATVTGVGNVNSMMAMDDSKDWVTICTEKSYIPTREDVGCILRVEVKALAVMDGKILAGPVVVVTEPVLSAPRGPPKRPLLAITGGSNSSGGARFRVLSYNILAELYATKQAYPYCNAWNLSWPYRKSIILQELDDAQGDIVCLQEVQTDHYEQHLSPFMLEKGYDGIFKQKTRDSMGQYGKVDGCATFWRRSKFMMVENYDVEFNECARHTATELGLDDGDNRRFINRLVKDNIAQIVVLEIISRSAVRLPRQSIQVCVANTHLYSNHQRPDVKLWQAYALMRELESFVLQRDIALIVCGDLNSEPDSAVYEFIMEGCLNAHRPELDMIDNIRVLPDQNNIVHSIELVSAMNSAMGEEPSFTNFTGKFRGTLDYICYTPSRLRVMAVSAIPEVADLENENGVGLPSASYPSDHLMLCCDLAFAVSGTGSVTRSSSASSHSSHSHNNHQHQQQHQHISQSQQLPQQQQQQQQLLQQRKLTSSQQQQQQQMMSSPSPSKGLKSASGRSSNNNNGNNSGSNGVSR